MIMLFIWYPSPICIIKCFRSTITIFFFRIFILFILPFIRNFYSIIPQIITNSISIIISFIFISFYIFWNLTLFSYFKYILFLFLLFHFPILWNFHTILYHYIFNSLSIFILQHFIMLKSFFRYFPIQCLYHSNTPTINILFTRINIFHINILIIYSFLKLYFIYSFTLITYPIIRYW